MSNDENQDHSRSISWRGRCPHCARTIRFRLRTDHGVFDLDAPERDWLESLSAAERELLVFAQSTGVLDSFERTMQQAKAGSLSNPAKSFLKFLAGMKLLEVPDKTALALLSEFPKKKVAVYAYGLVSALAVDGELCLFVPTTHLYKKKPKSAVTAVNAADGALNVAPVKELTRSMQDLRDWVKTRMGYVPLEGTGFLKEMRKRCYGAFGIHEKSRVAGGAQ